VEALRTHRQAFLRAVSKTSKVTDAMKEILKQEMFFERGIKLPGRSEVSLAATTPCRLQLRMVLT